MNHQDEDQLLPTSPTTYNEDEDTKSSQDSDDEITPQTDEAHVGVEHEDDSSVNTVAHTISLTVSAPTTDSQQLNIEECVRMNLEKINQDDEAWSVDKCAKEIELVQEKSQIEAGQLHLSTANKNSQQNFLSSFVIPRNRSGSLPQPLGNKSIMDTQHLDAFTKQCLHLFDGNWCVMKPVDGKKETKSGMEEGQEAESLRFLAQEKSAAEANNVNTRRLFHPHSLTKNLQTNIFVKCHSFELESGNLEPYYCSLELVNIATKQKLSEKFYFHLNSYSTVNDFLDDFNTKKFLLKYIQEEGGIAHAIFSLSHQRPQQQSNTASSPHQEPSITNISDLQRILSSQGDNSSAFGKDQNTSNLASSQLQDVFLLLMVEKTFQTTSNTDVLKMYHQFQSSGGNDANTQKFKHALDQYCVKEFRQPFLFAFAPLFELETNGETTPTEEKRNSRRLSTRMSFIGSNTASAGGEDRRSSRRLSFSAKLFQSKTNANSAFQQTTQQPYKLREGFIAMKHLYPLDWSTISPKQHNAMMDLLDLIQKEGTRDGQLKKYKHKPLNGFFIAEVSPFDSLRFENNVTDRKILLAKRKSTSLGGYKQIDLALDHLKKESETIKQTVCKASSTNDATTAISAEEKKQYLKFQANEFLEHVPYPFFTFFHLLYIYPETANFSKMKNPAYPSIKPSNMSVEISCIENNEARLRFAAKYSTNEWISKAQSTVQFDSKQPVWCDEFRMQLPLPIPSNCYLLFKFYHVWKKASKAAEKVLIGFSLLPLQDCVSDDSLLDRMHNLPMYAPQDLEKISKSDSFLRDSGSLQPIDAKRNTFILRTKLYSTIYPNEPSIAQFVKDCSPFLNCVNNNSTNPKFISQSCNAALEALSQLNGLEIEKCISHFPLIMDMLLTMMARAPDLLHLFVQNKEENSQKRGSKETSLIDSIGNSNALEAILNSNTSDSPANQYDLETQETFSDLENWKGALTEDEKKSNRSSVIMFAKRDAAVKRLNRRVSTNLSVGLTNAPGSASSASVEDKAANRRKSIMNRKSNDSSVLTESEMKMGDANFDLRRYLEQQQQLNTTTNPITKENPSEKKEKRKSIFGRRDSKSEEKKRESVDNSRKKSVDLNQQRQSSKNLPGISDDGNDFANFLNLTTYLYEMQSSTFATICNLIKKAGQLHHDTSRNNALLSSYVQFIFRDVVLSACPLCYSIAEQWTEILSKAEDNPSNAFSPVPSQDKRLSLQKRNSSSSPASFSMIDPIWKQSLQYAWFFFDIMLKSFLVSKHNAFAFSTRDSITSEEDEYFTSNSNATSTFEDENGVKFSRGLRELLITIADKVNQFCKEGETAMAQQLNTQVSIFLRDLFSTEMKASYRLELITVYLRHLKCDLQHSMDVFQILSHNPAFNLCLLKDNYLMTSTCQILEHSIIYYKRDDGKCFATILDTFANCCLSLEHLPTKQRQVVVGSLLPWLHISLSYMEKYWHKYQKHCKEMSKLLSWMLLHLPVQVIQQQLVNQMPLIIQVLSMASDVHVNSLFATSTASSALAGNRKSIVKTEAPTSPVTNLASTQQQQQVVQVYLKALQQVLVTCYDSMMQQQQKSQVVAVMVKLIQKVSEWQLPHQQVYLSSFVSLMNQLTTDSTLSSAEWKQLYSACIGSITIPISSNENNLVKQWIESLEQNSMIEDTSTVNHVEAMKVEEDGWMNVEYEVSSGNTSEPTTIIRAATLDKLIEKATSEKVKQLQVLEVLLLTYRSICTPFDLLQRFVARFLQVVANKSTLSNEQEIACLRIGNALKMWVTDYVYDFESNALAVQLFQFLNSKYSVASGGCSKVANQIKNRLEQFLLTGINERLISISSSEEEYPMPLIPKMKSQSVNNLQILDWNPLEVARQLTLIDCAIFKKIKPKETLSCNWMKKNKDVNSPNVVALITRFNQVTAWVIGSILKEDVDMKHRCKIMHHFLQIAIQCKKLNNLNSARAIISGLENASIHRLKKHWSKLFEKEEQLAEEWKQMNELFSTDGSFKRLREFMTQQTLNSQACVPYIGIYLTDLVFIEEGNKDYRTITNGDQSVELINFAKRRQVAKVITDLRMFQYSGNYKLLQVPVLEQYLDEAGKQELTVGDDENFKKSLIIEPRERN